MAGNTFGQLFTVTTAGESHGSGYVGVIDGCPPGLALTEEDIQVELDKRKPGSSQFTSQRREKDKIEIISGLYEGVTTGTPIGLLVRNQDQRSRDYETIAKQFRPGHADFTYQGKYGLRDPRGGGRASARETLMRVAAGAIAKKYLKENIGVEILAYLEQMGSIVFEEFDEAAIAENPFFFPDRNKVPELEALITTLRREGDSIGALITVEAAGLPVGLGEPVFDRLDADIAKALMSINAVKGVEIGDGFACVEQRGSEHRDEVSSEGFLSNHAGGVLGGITNGECLVARMALKPTSSITTPGRSLDLEGNSIEVVTQGRHDPCVGVRAAPIAEAMVALVIMDHWLRYRAQCFDCLVEVKE